MPLHNICETTTTDGDDDEEQDEEEFNDNQDDNLKQDIHGNLKPEMKRSDLNLPY